MVYLNMTSSCPDAQSQIRKDSEDLIGLHTARWAQQRSCDHMQHLVCKGEPQGRQLFEQNIHAMYNGSLSKMVCFHIPSVLTNSGIDGIVCDLIDSTESVVSRCSLLTLKLFTLKEIMQTQRPQIQVSTYTTRTLASKKSFIQLYYSWGYVPLRLRQ